jgi:hypothetical protein
MRLGTSTSVCYLRYCGLLALCAALCIAVPTGAQTGGGGSTPRVQILNGKTGRPLANQKIVLMGQDGVPSHSNHDFGAEITDGEGYAPLPELGAPLIDVLVFVEWHQPCSKANQRNFAEAKVRLLGVVSENSCRPRITMFPQPGTLIFYVREETLLEKMRH